MNRLVRNKELFNLLKLQIATFLLKFSRLEFIEAAKEKELEQVFRIRYDIYFNEGYIEPRQSQKFEDDYDLHSINFLIKKGTIPIGAFRLTLNSPIGFSFESYANFERPNVSREHMAEVSRLCIYKNYRGGRLIMFGVIKTIYNYTCKLGINYLYIGTQEKLAEHTKSYGVSLRELKERPPTEENLKNRELLKGYFAKNHPKHYLIDIKRSIENMLLHY